VIDSFKIDYALATMGATLACCMQQAILAKQLEQMSEN
jgi:hypothetical protein